MASAISIWVLHFSFICNEPFFWFTKCCTYALLNTHTIYENIHTSELCRHRGSKNQNEKSPKFSHTYTYVWRAYTMTWRDGRTDEWVVKCNKHFEPKSMLCKYGLTSVCITFCCYCLWCVRVCVHECECVHEIFQFLFVVFLFSRKLCCGRFLSLRKGN